MPLPNICTMEGDSLVYDLSLVGRPEDGNVGPAYLTPALSALSLLNLQDPGVPCAQGCHQRLLERFLVRDDR